MIRWRCGCEQKHPGFRAFAGNADKDTEGATRHNKSKDAHEEGKIRNLTGCRRIDSTIIAGAFFIVGDDGEDFRSLTEQETSHWLERFAQPEEITQKEVSDDMWFKFYTF